MWAVEVSRREARTTPLRRPQSRLHSDTLALKSPPQSAEAAKPSARADRRSRVVRPSRLARTACRRRVRRSRRADALRPRLRAPRARALSASSCGVTLQPPNPASNLSPLASPRGSRLSISGKPCLASRGQNSKPASRRLSSGQIASAVMRRAGTRVPSAGTASSARASAVRTCAAPSSRQLGAWMS
eukprot:scaffold59855_cov24-Tisochrysis_lutea.AAC.2